MMRHIDRTSLLTALAVALIGSGAHKAPAQTVRLAPPSLVHKVSSPTDRLDLTVNESRILTMDQKIPQFQVNNPEILELTALSPNQIQIHARKAGVTQVNLWDENEKIYTLDVMVFGDARELTMLLESEFPNCSLRIRPVSNGVLVSGYVDQPDHVASILSIAEEYYPKVLSNMTVGGVHQVLLHVKAMEVSRTKLRSLGIDWELFAGDAIIESAISGAVSASTFSFSILGADIFSMFFDALRDDNLMKVLAEPTLVTVSGRPAYFQVGGEFPILVPAGLGTVSIEYKKFGTQVDFVPIILGNGRIRLEVRPRVSEVDNTRSVVLNGAVIPGLRVREVDTGVEMMAGQTLAIAGLVQSRVESNKRGIPWVADLPYVGTFFRRVEERYNEVELLILVTPELIDAMDAHEVPPCGPGLRTTSPKDCELYFKGHLEVPMCCPPGSAGTQAGCMQTMAVDPGFSPPVDPMGPFPGPPSSPFPEPAPLPGPDVPSIQPAQPDQAGIGTPGSLRARPVSSGSRQYPSRPQGRRQSSGNRDNMGLPGFIGPLGFDAQQK